MKTVKVISIPLLSAAAVLLAGCVVTSVYPFYFEKDVAFEPALVGDWKNAGNPDEHWRFERAGGDGYRVVFASQTSTNAGEAHWFKLEGQAFLDFTAPKWQEDIQPQPVPSHILARVTQLKPTIKMLELSYDWLGQLLATNPAALRHLVIKTGDKPKDRRLVLTADTAELQHFVVKHLKTEGAWGTAVELKSEPAISTRR